MPRGLFTDAAILPDSVVDQTCYWSFADLFYFDEQIINLTVEMPSFEFMGDTLTSYTTITTFDDLGAELSVYEDSISQILACAYDPNDKTVFPKGDGDFGNILPTTPFLEYTVRFQNTGTDTAINIVIKDQLNESLDWSSLELLGNSHPMTAYVDHLGKAVFTFNDIMLPDSIVNELASHAFLKYRINLLPDLPLGTVITNTAKIYFDLNPAVVTNTTINTLFDPDFDDSGIDESEMASILVYPNPFTDITTIYFGESLGENLSIRVFDVIGNQVYQERNVAGNKYELSRATLGKGIYILTVQSNDLNQPVQTARLVVQ
ncbi:MAG: T9SS type A sorting domain-containing protein [Crocinitomix sp.]|nr:T9SS type A sorting domain-containing protein [Crocinitomix sp.]